MVPGFGSSGWPPWWRCWGSSPPAHRRRTRPERSPGRPIPSSSPARRSRRSSACRSATSSRSTTRWPVGRRCPVQVDQRKTVELNTMYHQPANTIEPGERARVRRSATRGPAQAPASSAPSRRDRVHGQGRRRRGAVVQRAGQRRAQHRASRSPSPINASGTRSSFVYLFRQSGGLDPGAGQHYVNYDFHLTSGAYKTTYHLRPGSEPRELDRHDAVLRPSLQRPLARRRLEHHRRVVESAPTSSTATRRCSRRATAAAARTPSTAPRARSSPTSTGRCGRSAATSARTAARTPSARTSSTPQREDIITDLRVHAISGESWTSSTTARRPRA